MVWDKEKRKHIGNKYSTAALNMRIRFVCVRCDWVYYTCKSADTSRLWFICNNKIREKMKEKAATAKNMLELGEWEKNWRNAIWKRNSRNAREITRRNHIYTSDFIVCDAQTKYFYTYHTKAHWTNSHVFERDKANWIKKNTWDAH